jgi:structure-specific endonuclease subunit SLX1
MLVNCTEKRTYIGSTNDLKRRIRQHNGEIKGGARATQTDRPWTILCCAFSDEIFDRSQACSFETHWKRSTYSDQRKTSVYPKIEKEHFETFFASKISLDECTKKKQQRLCAFLKTCRYLNYFYDSEK